MKINKRACRKYADPKLTFNQNHGLLICNKIHYIIRTAVKNIAGRRLLLLFFYPREQVINGIFIPQFTVFQAPDEYVTLERDVFGSLKWRTSRLQEFICSYYPILRFSAFYTAQDEKRVIRFCKYPELNGYLAIDQLQLKIFENNCRKRKLKREQAIIRQMRGVGSLPKGMKEWAKQEILPAYLFYEYARNRKKQTGYCTACKCDVTAEMARHGKAGYCPHCGKPVTYRAIGKGTHIYDKVTVQAIQRINDQLIIRVCKMTASYRNYRKPHIDFWECARLFLSGDNAESLQLSAYYYEPGRGISTHWLTGYRPNLFSWRYNYEADLYGHLYTKFLSRTLHGTPWQYSQIGLFYKEYRQPLDAAKYLGTYLRYPVLEYLVKLRLYIMVSDVLYDYSANHILNLNGRRMQEVLKINPSYLPLLQNIQAGIRDLELIQHLEETNMKAETALLQWYHQNMMTNPKLLTFCLQYVPAKKLIRYLHEQFLLLKDTVIQTAYRRFESEASILSEYKDYLRFCKDLNYDLKNEFILYPKNMMKAHDRASDMFKQKKAEIDDAIIKKAYPALKQRYRFKKYGMTIIPPQSATEIVAEGQELHHCVGFYLPQIVKGESVILFLRQTKQPDKPFYTIELQNGELVQIRGMCNCMPTEQVEKYLAAWKRNKLNPLQQAA